MADSISIRPWIPEDEHQTWEILKQGNYSNFIPWVKFELKTWSSFVFILAVTCFGYLWTQSLILTILTCASAVGVIFLLVYLLMLFYLYGPPLKDMSNIKDIYLKNTDSTFLVAVINNRVVGTIAVAPTSETSDGSKVAILKRMAVHRQFRRLGIAKRLVLELISFCERRGYSRIQLVTTAAQKPAQRLYESLGFEIISFEYEYVLNGWVPFLCYSYSYKLKESNAMR